MKTFTKQHINWTAIAFHFALYLSGCSAGTSPSNIESDLPKSEAQIAAQPTKLWWNDSLTTMTQGSDLVVTGQVISKKTSSARANWLPRAIIATTVTLKIDRVLKGTSPETIQIDTIGGCLEGTCLDKSHEPSFEDGERALLFLNKTDASKFLITNGESGKICLDGRYVHRNSETIEVPESELLAVVSSAVALEQEVQQ